MSTEFKFTLEFKSLSELAIEFLETLPEVPDYNDKFINLIISTTMNIINTLYSLINEIISNNESKLYQDTTTWNIPYIDTQYVDYNIKNER